jgi:DNA replication protein DnaC
MHHANLEKLKSLRLFGMVRALQELTGLDDRGRLDFEDQLALLIERETADRANTALEMRLKRARLRQAACFENLDLKASRGLDKGLIRDLFTGRWICQHRHVILTGATGSGKTWAIRRHGKASACSTPGCRACWTTSRRRASAREPAL